MKIAAVADIHYPRFFSQFEQSLQDMERPDLFLLAGDIVNRGNSEGYPIVTDTIDSFFGNVPIIACFGNEDYNMFHNEQQIVELVGTRVTFLDNRSISIPIRDTKIGIVGVSIVSERVKEVASIRSVFEEQARRISKSLEELGGSVSELIILSHFSPLAESESSFSWWFREAIKHHTPSLIIHGHLHDTKENKVVVESTPIYNVTATRVESGVLYVPLYHKHILGHRGS